MYCTCLDWKENIDKLNAPFVFSSIHGIESNVKQFIFCPWCAKELKSIPDETN